MFLVGEVRFSKILEGVNSMGDAVSKMGLKGELRNSEGRQPPVTLRASDAPITGMPLFEGKCPKMPIAPPSSI